MRRHGFLTTAASLALLGSSFGVFVSSAHAENTVRSNAEAACQSDSVLLCEDWEDGDWVGWRDVNVSDSLNRGGFRGGPTCATGECLLPYPGYNNSRAMALKLPKDAPDAIYPKGGFNKSVGPNDTIYLRWRAYWSPNFEFNYQNTKHFYLLTDAASSGGSYRVGFFVRPPVKGGDPTVGVPYIHLYKNQIELAPNSWQYKIGESDVRYFANQPGSEDFRIKGGKWYEFEMRVTPNPQGQAFGAHLQFWVDGKLMGDFHDDNVSIRKANDQDVFDGVWLSSYFGGGGQSTHPEQYVIYDDIIASTKRIGSTVSDARPSSPTNLRVGD